MAAQANIKVARLRFRLLFISSDHQIHKYKHHILGYRHTKGPSPSGVEGAVIKRAREI